MVFYCRIKINGVYYDNLEYGRVRKGINNKSGTFNLVINNQNGIYYNTFNVSQEVYIYLDENPTPTTCIFGGLIDEVNYVSTEGQIEGINLSGRDFSCLLQDRSALEVYQNMEASAIIRNLCGIYAPNLSMTNVDTTTVTLTTMIYKQRSVFECIKELNELTTFDFWVDENKNLYFKAANSLSTDRTLDNTNLRGQATFTINRDDLFNDIWVYGGTTMIGWQNSFTADGTGSVFSLDYKPYNTKVTLNTITKMGTTLNSTMNLTSGTHYLIDFDNKNIIFTSGTECGNNIPAALGSVVVTYDRSRPIVKQSIDNNSVSVYNQRTKTITNKEITDPLTAQSIADAQLSLDKDPKRVGDLNIKGISSLEIGRTIIVNLPNQNINNETFKITEANYDITQKNLLNEEVLSIKISERLKDITDVLAKIISDIKKLQAQDIDPTELITRVMNGTGSFSVDVFSWEMKTRTISGGARWDRCNWDDPVVSVWDNSGLVGPWVLEHSGGRYT